MYCITPVGIGKCHPSVICKTVFLFSYTQRSIWGLLKLSYRTNVIIQCHINREALYCSQILINCHLPAAGILLLVVAAVVRPHTPDPPSPDGAVHRVRAHRQRGPVPGFGVVVVVGVQTLGPAFENINVKVSQICRNAGKTRWQGCVNCARVTQPSSRIFQHLCL